MPTFLSSSRTVSVRSGKGSGIMICYQIGAKRRAMCIFRVCRTETKEEEEVFEERESIAKECGRRLGKGHG